ncbi:efflux transporter outer membrane subunit [Sphingomonas trueperi]|uniref:efflux transporter outer membrane subunit n=1 Tax=Sphingomonas trueperi TaxID=53317 RepID=UPI000F153BBB
MKRTLATTAAIATLASCTAGPDYRAPSAMRPLSAPPHLIEAKGPAFAVEEPPNAWWRLYAAPELDALVDKALRYNADLRTALATLEAAEAALRGTELARTVQTGLASSATYGQGSGDARGAPNALRPAPLYAWSAAVSYDVDLAGRIRRGIQASVADIGVAQAALDLARVNVAAAVTGSYATVCAAGDQIAVTNRSIALAENIVSVAQRRFKGGIAGVNDVVRARALLAQTEAGLPSLIARQRAALYLLATLVGDPPEQVPAGVASCATPLVLRRPIPVGDGASLLKRRPDVREAERRLAGSVARIGLATSQLYPSITLGGQLGIAANKGSDLLSNRAFNWGAGPLIHWSFPNISAARSDIARAGAVARGQLASFDGTVLVALRETETALSNLARQLDAEQSLQRARSQAAEAAQNTERLYRGGVGQFIDTLDAERTLIASDAALADARARVADMQVTLFLALGGGWQDAPAPAETPLDDIAIERRKPRRAN